MRRLVLAATLVLALVLPSSALAIALDYSGPVEGDPFSYFGFNVGKVNGHRVLDGLGADTSSACTDNTTGRTNWYTALNGLGTEMKVKGGKFHTTKSGTFGGLHYTFKIAGEFRSHNTKAVGTFNARSHSPSGKDCYTGTQAWKALRGGAG